MELEFKKTEYIEGSIKAPPSKSYTHRAIIISALAEGKSTLYSPLLSEDTLASMNAVRALGCNIQLDNDKFSVYGTGGRLKSPDDVVDVKNSGTTLRIMSSVASLAPDFTVLTGDNSLRTRPMQDLLDALYSLGVMAVSTRNNGKPPICIKGGFKGGKTKVSGNVSSQFISSLLITAPYADDGVDIIINSNFISKPYVDMTIDVMEKFGIKTEFDKKSFHIDPGKYKGRNYTIEGDYSSSSYLIGAAAALGGKTKICNLFAGSKQGDKQIIDIIQRMGAQVHVKEDEIIVSSDGNLEGVEVSLQNSPDLLPTVAALGAIAKGETIIQDVEHARFKETDRIHACAQELSKLGVELKELPDGLHILGGASGGRVNSHGDHRIMMALSLIGLKIGNMVIEDADVYAISFPYFPETMNLLGCKIEK